MRHSALFNRLAILALAAPIALLSGCVTPASVRSSHDYTAASKMAQTRADAARNVSQEPGFEVLHSGFYAEKTPLVPEVKLGAHHDLPYKLAILPAHMDILAPTPLSAVVTNISRMTGVQVSIAQDVLDNNAGQLGTVLKSGGNGAGGGHAQNKTNAEPIMLDRVDYPKGNLDGLLNLVTGKLGLSWKWNGSSIDIFRYETKLFRLYALKAESSTQASVVTQSSSMAQGGGGGTQAQSNTKATSGQVTKVSSSSDPWNDVITTIQGMLSPDGRMSVSPTSATLVVHDTPMVLDSIGKMIAKLNAIYTSQVALNIEVYAVQRTDTDNYNVAWNLAWQNAANKMGRSVNYTTASATGSASSLVIGKNSGPFAGSSLALSALTSLGKTTLITSGQVITLNGQTVPMNVSKNEAYLQSETTTLSGGGSSGLSSTQLVPGMVTEGFSMNFTPLILPDGNVLMRYSVDISTIDGIQTFSTPDGTASIQLPQQEVRNFMQNVKVHSGQTLVLSGFQQVSDSGTDSGVGSSHFWVLGGGRNASAINRTIVIVVTPYILKGE